MNFEGNLGDRGRGQLSAALRDVVERARAAREPVPTLSDPASLLASFHPPADPLEQIDRLLLHLARRDPHGGTYVLVNMLQPWDFTVTGAETPGAGRWALGKAIELGYVEQQAPSELAFRLTTLGWSHLRELRAREASGPPAGPVIAIGNVGSIGTVIAGAESGMSLGPRPGPHTERGPEGITVPAATIIGGADPSARTTTVRASPTVRGGDMSTDHTTKVPHTGTAPFGLHELQDAARDFAIAADEFSRAGTDLWESTLRAFVHLCRNDPVLLHITQPLRQTEFDPADWWRRRKQENGTAGQAAPLRLPADRMEAASMMLRLLELIADDPAPGAAFAAQIVMTGVRNNYDRQAQEASGVMLPPVRRYVEARLETMLRAARPAPAVSGDTHNYFAPVAFAAPGASFSQSPVTVTQTINYQATSELGREILGWRELLDQVEQHRHGEVQQALETLARAADGGPTKPSTLVQAAETVVEAHPTLGARAAGLLQRWGGKAAGVVATGMATEAGKQLVQHHDQVLRAIAMVLGAG